MAKYKTAPTKTNLLKTKRSFAFASEGHRLLEDKREILIAELLNLKERAKEAEEKFHNFLKQAYKSLQTAMVKEGESSLQQIATAAAAAPEISATSHKVMGVSLPRLRISFAAARLFYFPFDNSLSVDEAIVNFRQVLRLLVDYAQYRASILRLAREVKKTIRRVNALEKIYLPDYEETITYIEGFLQEQERESFFVQKLIKKKIEEERNGARAEL